MSAVISADGQYRYRLDREVKMTGCVIAYFGVNCSTADAKVNDQTVRKWIEFTRINDGKRFIVGNPFAFRCTDVKDLTACDNPVGPENDHYLDQIIAEADILVPCWGNRTKVPKRLRYHFDVLTARLFASGKPVRVFGTTKSGDPCHPLMLGYDTNLVQWVTSLSIDS